MFWVLAEVFQNYIYENRIIWPLLSSRIENISDALGISWMRSLIREKLRENPSFLPKIFASPFRIFSGATVHSINEKILQFRNILSKNVRYIRVHRSVPESVISLKNVISTCSLLFSKMYFCFCVSVQNHKRRVTNETKSVTNDIFS